MNVRYITVVFLLLLPSLVFAGDKDPIRSVLAKQAAEWNKGNIEQYMDAGYWHSDSLLFIGKTGPTYGYNNTLQNYKRSYSDTARMGHLDFTDLKLTQLSDSYYFVVGKWALQRSV